jgi:hypothetical protein
MSKNYFLPGARVTHIWDPARDLPGTDPVVGTVVINRMGRIHVKWPARVKHIEPWHEGRHNVWAVRVAKAPAR